MRKLLLGGALGVSIALSACGDQERNEQGNAAVPSGDAQGVEALEGADGLSTVSRLVKKAGLEPTLKGRGSYTIFAPSDQAFAALPEEQRKLLESEEGRPQLIALLRQHMSPGYMTGADLAKGLSEPGGQVELASLGAAPIVVRKVGKSVVLGKDGNAPQLIGEPVEMGNSIAYRIDRLLPPPAQ